MPSISVCTVNALHKCMHYKCECIYGVRSVCTVHGSATKLAGQITWQLPLSMRYKRKLIYFTSTFPINLAVATCSDSKRWLLRGMCDPYKYKMGTNVLSIVKCYIFITILSYTVCWSRLLSLVYTCIWSYMCKCKINSEIKTQ